MPCAQHLCQKQHPSGCCVKPSVSAYDHRLLRPYECASQAKHRPVLCKVKGQLSCLHAVQKGVCTRACLVQQLMQYCCSQGSEEDVAHAVKQHLVKSLVSHGASDAVTNQASALRR